MPGSENHSPWRCWVVAGGHPLHRRRNTSPCRTNPRSAGVRADCRFDKGRQRRIECQPHVGNRRHLWRNRHGPGLRPNSFRARRIKAPRQILRNSARNPRRTRASSCKEPAPCPPPRDVLAGHALAHLVVLLLARDGLVQILQPGFMASIMEGSHMAPLGAVLVAAFLGGAIAIHVQPGRLGTPPQIIRLALSLAGLRMRDARIRSVLRAPA